LPWRKPPFHILDKGVVGMPGIYSRRVDKRHPSFSGYFLAPGTYHSYTTFEQVIHGHWRGNDLRARPGLFDALPHGALREGFSRLDLPSDAGELKHGPAVLYIGVL